MVRPELIIFDMDGLMFDTEKIIFNSWKQAALNYGYEIKEELFYKTVGINLEGTKKIYLEHFGDKFPIEKVTEQRFNLAENLIKSNGVPIKNGLFELLNFLKEKEIRKAVATSTSREKASLLLEMASVTSYFDCILCGDEIKNSKPHPEIFLKVAEKLNCSAENCLVLEDSEAGVLAASRAGMLPIMIPDFNVPKKEVKKLAFRVLSTLLEVKMLLENVI